MRLLEAIARADELRPNAISNSIKADWVYQLEGELAEMIRMPYPKNPFPNDGLLIMPSPKDNIYELYLCAMIDNANEDSALYMNDMEIANAAITDAKKWYMRNFHKPCDSRVVFNNYNYNCEKPEMFVPSFGVPIDKKMLLTAIEEYFEQNPVAPGKNGIDGKDGVDGHDGYTPVKDIDYRDGIDGENGKDGITPRISMTPTDDGVLIQAFVGDVEDSRAIIKNGSKGDKGDAGISQMIDSIEFGYDDEYGISYTVNSSRIEKDGTYTYRKDFGYAGLTVSGFSMPTDDGHELTIRIAGQKIVIPIKDGKDGADGDKYIINSEDYTKIADIVISRLPSAEGSEF